MKKWIIGATLLVFTTLQVAAQHDKRGQASNPEERAVRTTEKMASKLQLSEDQKSQVMELNLEMAKKRQLELDQEAEMRKLRSEERKAHQDKLEAILTEEQRSKWEEIKEEQRHHRRPGGQVHHRNEGPKKGSGN